MDPLDADVNWMYIRGSEDVQDVFYSYVQCTSCAKGRYTKIWVALRKSFLLTLKLINNVYMEVEDCRVMFFPFPFGAAAWFE